MKNYILEGKTPKPVDDILEWATWFQTANRIVKSDMVDGTHISTVFLGVNHSFLPGDPPLLFETMIFGGEEDGYEDRYPTWEDAEAGHQKAIDIIKANKLINDTIEKIN